MMTMPLDNKKKILLVDDHPIIRKGIIQLLKQEADLEVVAEAQDASSALEQIGKTHPDLIISDISIPGSGIELIKNAKIHFEKIPILVLSMYDEMIYAERALRAGAKGYIRKQEAPEKIIQAIRRVLEGGCFISEPLASKLMFRATNGKAGLTSVVEELSDRELEVLRLIGQGLSTSNIAKELHLSIKTIETYREHIKQKLNLKNSRELVAYAMEWVKETTATKNF